ncbi:MAG: hypothetical protein COY40_01030 [Alphaproteobacteria bacterium CG_4_10_14_0_8_um_filter_53_9]|nr:MAG: hypothetical protein COY40_01030 [Alphaproteobacteria bacterium CG_4_10_14_0_8_um_filter_53_9]
MKLTDTPTYLTWCATNAWRNLWDWKARANRFEYLAFRALALIIMVTFNGLVVILNPSSTFSAAFFAALGLFLVISVAYSQTLISMRRLHDMNLSGKWYLGYLALLLGYIAYTSASMYTMAQGAGTLEEMMAIQARVALLQKTLMVAEIAIFALFAFIPGTKARNRFGLQQCWNPEGACAVDFGTPAAAPKTTTAAAPKPVAASAKPAVKKATAQKAKPKTAAKTKAAAKPKAKASATKAATKAKPKKAAPKSKTTKTKK